MCTVHSLGTDMDISSLGFVAGKQAVSLAANVAEQLSGAGKSFLDILTSATNVDGVEQPVGETESISKEDLLDLLQQFQKRANFKFAANGVDTVRPVHLKAGPAGSIEAGSGHPDRAAIEQVLSTDAELRALFEAIAAAAEELHGVDPQQLGLVLDGTEATIVS
ncbi:MAG: hypothetical protein ACI9HK_002479 [Pirellulaceae bacterium]|jgi:hypothetical protein